MRKITSMPAKIFWVCFGFFFGFLWAGCGSRTKGTHIYVAYAFHRFQKNLNVEIVYLYMPCGKGVKAAVIYPPSSGFVYYQPEINYSTNREWLYIRLPHQFGNWRWPPRREWVRDFPTARIKIIGPEGQDFVLIGCDGHWEYLDVPAADYLRISKKLLLIEKVGRGSHKEKFSHRLDREQLMKLTKTDVWKNVIVPNLKGCSGNR